jgi:hypothetical protein
MRDSAVVVPWILVGLVACVSLTLAHHGTSTYDMTTELGLTGTVKTWSFRNPHSWLELTVAMPKGAVEEWSIESAPPDYLARQGWSASTLKAGETVTALVSPLKGEPRRGILLEVKRSSGETLIVRPRGSFGRPARVN